MGIDFVMFFSSEERQRHRTRIAKNTADADFVMGRPSTATRTGVGVTAAGASILVLTSSVTEQQRLKKVLNSPTATSSPWSVANCAVFIDDTSVRPQAPATLICPKTS